MTATKPKDEKDPKRAHVMLSNGREVVGPGYSRVTSVAAKVMDKRENSGNHSRVNRVSKIEQQYLDWVSQATHVSQNSNMDRQADRVSWVIRVSPNSSPDEWTDRVSWVGNTEQKIGGSSRVANTESRVTENSASTESWVIENSAKTESQVTQKLANTEIRVSENSANTKNWVMQDPGGRGGRKPEEVRGAAQSKRLAPW
jgi:hypothetical protein